MKQKIEILKNEIKHQEYSPSKIKKDLNIKQRNYANI